MGESYAKYIFSVGNNHNWSDEERNVSEWEWFDHCAGNFIVNNAEVVGVGLLWDVTRYE